MDTSRAIAQRMRGAPTGFALGLFGYLAAMVGFGYESLFIGRADPADQLWSGLITSCMVGFVATIWVVVSLVRIRRRQPWKSAGLVVGMALGVTLLILLTLRIVPVIREAPGGCDCSPLIDQIKTSVQ